jgi:hypothetical protein
MTDCITETPLERRRRKCREYYRSHRTEILKSLKDPGKRSVVNARRRELYAANPDKIREYNRSVRVKYRGKYSEYAKEYRTKNAALVKAKKAAHYKLNKEAYRSKQLMRKYGVSLDEYNAMYAFQHGRCAICGESHPVLMVDHCHNSKRVRKLLCNKCNAGLGFFRENVQLLENAIDYIQQHKVAT